MLRILLGRVNVVGRNNCARRLNGIWSQHTYSARYFCSARPKIEPDVQERVMELSRRFLEKVKDAKLDKLSPTASFEELGMDSLDSVDFIVILEESFGFDVSNEDAENRIRSIQDACVVFTEYIQKREKEGKEGGDKDKKQATTA